jgi:acetyl-CoA acetyltransferase
MARWLGPAVAGVDPGVMGYDPVPATQKLLKRLGLTLDDIGLIETQRSLCRPKSESDAQAGHASRNHQGERWRHCSGLSPGCSGTRIPVTLLHEMKRRATEEKRPYYGLATLCVGVGMGISTVIEYGD